MRLPALAILFCLTVIAVAAAGWSLYQRQAKLFVADVPDLLLPNLSQQINAVNRLQVATPNGAFSIEKQADGTWQVPEKGGYPVRFETVKQAVVGLAGLQPIARKTADPKKYYRLQVVAPAGNSDTQSESDNDGAGEGTLLKLTDGDNQPLAAVIVGKTKSVPTDARPGWYYVRLEEDAGAWLASGRIDVKDTPKQWLDAEMPQIERKRIRHARSTNAEGEAVTVAREHPDIQDFAVADLPEGKRPIHDTVGNALGAALGYLSFDDVMKADQLNSNGLAHETVFTTFDGLQLTVRLLTIGEATWAKIAADYVAEADRRADLTEDQAAALEDVAAVKKEAEAINQRFAEWAYQLPAYKVKDLQTTASDLLMDAEDDGNS